MKAFRVDFAFTREDQASMYVIANNEKDAGDGALSMLEKTPDLYTDVRIEKVEEYVQTPKETEVHLN